MGGDGTKPLHGEVVSANGQIRGHDAEQAAKDALALSKDAASI
jgi:hypothetical protein